MSGIRHPKAIGAAKRPKAIAEPVEVPKSGIADLDSRQSFEPSEHVPAPKIVGLAKRSVEFTEAALRDAYEALVAADK